MTGVREDIISGTVTQGGWPNKIHEWVPSAKKKWEEELKVVGE